MGNLEAIWSIYFAGFVFVLPSFLIVFVWLLLFFFVVLLLWLLFVLLLFVLLLFAVCCCRNLDASRFEDAHSFLKTRLFSSKAKHVDYGGGPAYASSGPIHLHECHPS